MRFQLRTNNAALAERNGEMCTLVLPEVAAGVAGDAGGNWAQMMQHFDESSRVTVRFDGDDEKDPTNLVQVSPFDLRPEKATDEEKWPQPKDEAQRTAESKAEQNKRAEERKANETEQEDLESYTVPELRDLAEDRDIDLTGLTVKADIVAAIKKGSK